jgi:hypothetical protein
MKAKGKGTILRLQSNITLFRETKDLQHQAIFITNKGQTHHDFSVKQIIAPYPKFVTSRSTWYPYRILQEGHCIRYCHTSCSVSHMGCCHPGDNSRACREWDYYWSTTATKGKQRYSRGKYFSSCSYDVFKIEINLKSLLVCSLS